MIRQLRYLVLLPLALSAGCAEDIDLAPPLEGRVQAVFDPSATPPAVPTPTDIVKNRTTGLLEIPETTCTKDADCAGVTNATGTCVEDPSDSSRKTCQIKPAQAYLDQFLNTLDGFPTTAVAEVRFSGELDKSTVTDKTVLVYDVTSPTSPKPVTGLALDYRKVAGTDGKPATSLVRIHNAAGWSRASTYAVFVLGGDKGVKDTKGKPVIRSALFELAAADRPLCEYQADYYLEAASGECKQLGNPAARDVKGCCEFNYSALLDSVVKKQVRDDPRNADLSFEEVEVKVHRAILASATDFEKLRQGLAPLFTLAQSLKLKPEDIAVLWGFSTVGLTEAVFEPTAVPPRLPTPTDLARDPKTGMLNISDVPGQSKAQTGFNDYLSTLDGYSILSTGALSFTGDIDASTVSKGFVVYEVGSSGSATKVDATASYNGQTRSVTLTFKGPLKPGTKYLLGALAGESYLKNKDTKIAKYPRRSALMHLALFDKPLCDFDASTRTCRDAPISSFVDDPDSKKQGLTAEDKATLFEGLRRQLDPDVKAFVSAASVQRDDLVAFWSFTTSSQTELIYDAASGNIPFPNNLLLDRTTGKVDIPATPGESPADKALRQGLNTLDGFTTQGSYFVKVSGKIDKNTVTAANIIGLNTDNPLAPPSFEFEYDVSAGLIKATPKKPLAENTTYAIVIRSKPGTSGKKAASGVTDDQGNYVIPSSFMALIRLPDPVFDATKGSLVAQLDTLTAGQIEVARKAHQPLFQALGVLGVTRDEVAAAWTFTTQSITKPLMQLRALPWSVLAAVDKNKPQLTGTIDPTLTGFPGTAPKSNIAAWVPAGSFKTWIALDEAGTGAFLADPTKGTARDVNFFMFLPTGTMPATGWPTVVFQHGLGASKTAVFSVADSLAKAGYATIAFDSPYHGSRSWCVKDAECDGGTCDTKTGTCSSGKLKDSNGDGTPDASGNDRFLNTANPFAIRDNLRQYIIDASALLRTLTLDCSAAGPGCSLSGTTTVKLDLTKVDFVGVSMGSILGTMLLATDPLPRRAVLNVPGAPAADIFLAENSSPTFKSTKDALLKAQGITEGTAEHVQLLTTFNWIMDPADPGNFAGFVQAAAASKRLDDLVQTGKKVTQKDVIVQLAGNDQVIPRVPFGDYLANVIGADTTKTVYAGQGHSFLMKAEPSLAATGAAQTQMATFLATGTVCTPNLTTGACN